MCEVGSCCACISLYKGCIIIGFVTMLASIGQVLVFSFILSASSKAIPSTVNSTDKDEGSPFYTFKSSSSLCPFGFIPSNETNNGTINVTESLEERMYFDGTEFQNSTNTTSPVKTISCLAPPKGVLWAIALASGFYAPFGGILIIGIKKGISCLLSMWFFYTVGYNLLCLIVALTDGVYASAGDVSSYITCLVTAYCVIVVDSYYEKLLRHERAATSATAHGRPSLVVVKSTPVSPTSPESSPVFNPPIGKFINVPPGYAPPGEASDLLLPSRASPSRNNSEA